MSLLPRFGLPTINTFIRPSKFIKNQRQIHYGSLLEKQWAVVQITVIFIVNTVLFALPIAAGSATSIEEFFHHGVTVSKGLIFISGVTFWIFHTGLVVTRNHDDLVASYQTVVYSTGIYLALILGYLYSFLGVTVKGSTTSPNPGPVGTVFKTWIENFAFLVNTISHDLLDGLYIIGGSIEIRGVHYPGIEWNIVPKELSNPFPTETLSTFGNGEYIILGIGLLFVGGYVYSFYLAAQIRHGASRDEAIIVSAITIMAPAVAMTVGMMNTGSPTPIWLIGILIVYFGFKTTLTAPTYA